MRFFISLRSVLFILIISTPMFITFTVGNEFLGSTERFEKRRLAQIPTLPLSLKQIPSYTKKWESYYNDHFGFRLLLVRLHAYVTYYIYNDSPRENVILGKDGWFFRGRGLQRQENKKTEGTFDTIRAGNNPLSVETLIAWQQALEERQHILAENGIKYIFTIAPKKALIYPEKLPTALRPPQGHVSRVEQIIHHLQTKSSVPVVDLVTALRTVKEENPDIPLFLKTDGHWNQIGAYHAYRSIIEKIELSYPDIPMRPIPLEQFSVRWKKNWKHKGFTAQLGVAIAEPYPQLKPKKENPLRHIYSFREKQISFPFATFLQEKERGIQRVNLTNRNQETLSYSYGTHALASSYNTILLTGDSFLQKCLHFFRPHSKHLLRLRTELSMNTHFLSLPDPLKPQIVIQEVAQRYIGLRPPQNP